MTTPYPPPHDDAERTPCTRQDDHDGDHENWYAQQSWNTAPPTSAGVTNIHGQSVETGWGASHNPPEATP